MSATASNNDKEELLLSCRYGDLEDVQLYVKSFGDETLSDVRDENGNTVLHMVCGNGHADLLDYLLPLVEPSLLAAQNNAKSTPLHWAALNSHLAVAQKLVQFESGSRLDLIDIKNDAGRSPLGEAEMAGWEEGAKWFVEVMNLDDVPKGKEAQDEKVDANQGVEVEIQDADGGIAKMSISGRSAQESAPPSPGSKDSTVPS